MLVSIIANRGREFHSGHRGRAQVDLRLDRIVCFGAALHPVRRNVPLLQVSGEKNGSIFTSFPLCLRFFLVPKTVRRSQQMLLIEFDEQKPFTLHTHGG